MIINHKPTIVWFSAITCNGNTHSLLSANSNRFELFLNSFNLIYHPSLTIDKTLEDILNQKEKIDFLLVEGSISSNKEFSNILDDSTFNHFNKLALKSNYIIAVGSCASYGGVHAKFTQNETICSVKDVINEDIQKNLKHEIVNLTGCPVHPEWILQTLFILKANGKISIDEIGRPKELYSNLAHHGCTRNEYFE